jgi:sugar phosphate isomerase/epimerase
MSALTRRDLLKLGAASAAAWTAGWRAARAQTPQSQAAPTTRPQETKMKKLPIGVQLWSVRDDCAKDLPGTLAALAKMGYAGVEFAGYHNRKAPELRKLLDDLGLKACGTHTGLDTLAGDAFKATVEFNQTLGNRFLIVPSLPGEHTGSVAALESVAKRFGELAEQAKAAGMLVGYHAHAGDLKPIDGRTPWDIIFSNTPPAVIMQLDTANCLAGGGDPVAILRKYPGRALSIHLKEHGGKEGAVIGEGAVKWPEVFALCEGPAGTQWYVVEQEVYATTPLDSVQRCLENLRKWGK